MADRKKILWGITDSDDRIFLSKMCDIAERSETAGKIMFSRFLDPKERMLVAERLSDDYAVSFFGGYEGAEREAAAFGGEPEPSEWHICALKICPRSKGTLSHRDYLGALLSLGIKREHVGDIVIEDGAAYVFATEEISEFIIMNLTRVASASVKISKTDDFSALNISRRFKETDVTVSSLRLDCVLGAVTGCSRSQAVAIIGEGLCRVNYTEVKNVRFAVKDGDVISVRGFGKAVIQTDSTLTRKGRLHIKVKKYI